MQWTLNDLQNWEELRSFVDTALLPLYLYREELSIPDQVERMTYLSNLAMAVEQRLKGRVLLFPLTYQVKPVQQQVTWRLPSGAHFYFVLHYSNDKVVAETDQSAEEQHLFYLPVSDEDLRSEIRFRITAEVLSEQIVADWQAVPLAKKEPWTNR